MGKEEKFPNSRKPSHWQVCGEFCNLRGQHNWEGKKKQYPRENAPNHNSQRSSPDTLVCHQWSRNGQGGMGHMLMVRTRPECPEDNLSVLMWDRNPNCGIDREKKISVKENFLVKGSNLTHSLACPQNKGLSEYQRRASQLHTGPSPAARVREAGV